ncbi:MAG: GyrI-like domain-containing protein [Hydrogeniiclostridium sp.]
MEYTVVNKKEFQVIGRTRRMTVHNNAHYEAIGTFWHEWEQDGMFERYSEKYCQGSPHCIDVSTPSPEPDAFDYTIGFMWNGKKDIDGLDCITVPGGLYAVFPVPDGCEDMGDFMSHIITEFLPSLGYELAGVDAEYFSDSKNEVWFLLKK